MKKPGFISDNYLSGRGLQWIPGYEDCYAMEMRTKKIWFIGARCNMVPANPCDGYNGRNYSFVYEGSRIKFNADQIYELIQSSVALKNTNEVSDKGALKLGEYLILRKGKSGAFTSVKILDSYDAAKKTAADLTILNKTPHIVVKCMCVLTNRVVADLAE